MVMAVFRYLVSTATDKQLSCDRTAVYPVRPFVIVKVSVSTMGTAKLVSVWLPMESSAGLQRNVRWLFSDFFDYMLTIALKGQNSCKR